MALFDDHLPKLFTGKRMSAEAFLSLDETQPRAELVDGVVVMMTPSPMPVHQLILMELVVQLHAYNARREAKVFVSMDNDVVFAPTLVYRPDIAVYAAGRVDGIPDRLDSVPDLVIEVISPSSRPHDLVTKRQDYEKFGVQEYVAIDPERNAMVLFASDAGVYREQQIEGEACTLTSISGLTINLSPIRTIIELSKRE